MSCYDPAMGAVSRLLASVLAFTLAAESQTDIAAPKFEVASIKPNSSSERMDYGGRGERGIFGRNISAAGWIQIAYQVRGFQIEGPGWILNERFDIEAQAEKEASGAVLLQMLQGLLAERFNLHMESRSFQLESYWCISEDFSPRRRLDSRQC